MHIYSVAFLNSLMGPDMLVIGAFALLIFGRRLPEVGKNLGRTLVEFKKGLRGSALDEAEEMDKQRTAPEPRVPQLSPNSKTAPASEEI